MWLKYQKVSSKMSTFDPRELVKTKDMETAKYPLKRFEPTLRTSLKVVIPMNLDRLKKHKVNVEKYMRGKNWKELNKELINASRTVQQLQATIRDLDKIRHQLYEKDVRQFDKQISKMKVEAREGIEEFASLQYIVTAQMTQEFPAAQIHVAIAKPSKDSDGLRRRDGGERSSIEENIDEGAGFSENQSKEQLLAMKYNDEAAACQSWDNLKSGLIELDGLVKDFAACVQHQQEMVDNIEDNIETTHNNVNSAATILGQASKYKTAFVPVAGAVVGGLVAGPIGLLAGFKLAGAAAAIGGGIVGYQGGKFWKQRHEKNVEFELSHLSKSEKKKQ